jgi:hypothetical protein
VGYLYQAVLMRLTRRNSIIGIGAIAAGAGVIGGTGAFTTASADREISVTTTGDASGQAAMNIEADPDGDHPSISGTGSTFSLNFEGLNDDTRFTFDDALGITPNSTDGPYTIEITNTPNGIGITGTNPVSGVNSGQTATFDVIVNLENTDPGNIGGGDSITISITS